VPFSVVALAESSEGWGCGIPLFAECAKNGPPLGLWWCRLTAGSHRAFCPVRNDKVLKWRPDFLSGLAVIRCISGLPG
jgi:hypothetical protein